MKVSRIHDITFGPQRASTLIGGGLPGWKPGTQQEEDRFPGGETGGVGRRRWVCGRGVGGGGGQGLSLSCSLTCVPAAPPLAQAEQGAGPPARRVRGSAGPHRGVGSRPLLPLCMPPPHAQQSHQTRVMPTECSLPTALDC